MISIYGIPFCNRCTKVVDELDSLQIPYEYYNLNQLSKDDFNRVMSEKKGNEAPLIFIDGSQRTYEEFNDFIRLQQELESKPSDWGVLSSKPN